MTLFRHVLTTMPWWDHKSSYQCHRNSIMSSSNRLTSQSNLSNLTSSNSKDQWGIFIKHLYYRHWSWKAWSHQVPNIFLNVIHQWWKRTIKCYNRISEEVRFLGRLLAEAEIESLIDFFYKNSSNSDFLKVIIIPFHHKK